MTYRIESRDLREQPTAVIRGSVPLDQISTWLGSIYQEVFGYLGRIGVQPAGPPFGRFTLTADGFNAEAGVPVLARIEREGRVQPSSLPGGKVAVTMHIGPYDTVGSAYEAVEAWIREHGHMSYGSAWESYLSEPDVEPETIRTEVFAPYLAA